MSTKIQRTKIDFKLQLPAAEEEHRRVVRLFSKRSKRITVQIRVNKTLHQRIKERAKEDKLTISKLTDAAFKNYLAIK